MADEVELSVQGEVALLQLRRPDRGNALRAAMFDALRRAVLRLSDSPPAFVVLTGEGADFCTGLDPAPDLLWEQFESVAAARDAHRAQEAVARIRGVLDGLGRLPAPSSRRSRAAATAPASRLALLADLRVAASGATFVLGEGRDGILTGFGGLSRAAVLLGLPRAGELALLGRAVPADEAATMGLVSRVVPDGTALSSALEAVQTMRRTSPAARMQTVLALRQLASRPDLFDAESQASARTWTAQDWQQARVARNRGQEPSW
ncbi:MAG: enoyl-CoA hydratase/isomerase family protein [Myxococcota bacterium]